MSALTVERDWARERAALAHLPEAERVLWAQIADEIDTYLARDPDVLPVIDDDQLNLLEAP